MQRRTMWTIGLGTLVALLIMASAGIITLFPINKAAAQAATPVQRTITVIGQGLATARPDRAIVRVGVETEATNPAEALEQNNTRIEALQAKLNELGISGDAIETSNFNIAPAYRGPNQDPNSYVVRNTLQVTISDLSRVGEVLNQLVQAGANRIHGLTYHVADEQPLRQQARVDAIQRARQQAEQYADAISGSLGQIVEIKEDSSGGMQPFAIEAGRASGAVPLEPGEQQIRANVQVTFLLNSGTAPSP